MPSFSLFLLSFQVLGLSFSPNGYYLASGGEDNTCRIWDLRKKKSVYMIPAHSNLISQVKFEPQEGYFLVTASYDMTAKVFFISIQHNCCTDIIIFFMNFFLGSYLICAPFHHVFCIIQIWSARDFKPVKTLSGHEAKVTSLDVAGGKSHSPEKKFKQVHKISVC